MDITGAMAPCEILSTKIAGRGTTPNRPPVTREINLILLLAVKIWEAESTNYQKPKKDRLAAIWIWNTSQPPEKGVRNAMPV